MFYSLASDCHSSEDGDIRAIDGKILFPSYGKCHYWGAIHIISALSTLQSLGQIDIGQAINMVKKSVEIYITLSSRFIFVESIIELIPSCTDAK